MEPLHNYNPSVCCWNCDHYQRYDPELRPTACDGECRLEAVKGALFITDFIPDPQDRADFGHNKETAFYWAHISCGLRMRCSRFEATTEPELPQSPMSFNCQHEKPTLTADWKAWIKPGRKSCFTCGWFEPALCQHKNDKQPDNGCCLHNPPLPRQFHYFEPMLPRAEVGAPATITGALGLWCSKWEGPRPEIGYTNEDPEPVESALDAYTKWEDGRTRLTWLASLQIAKVKEMKRKMQAKKPNIIKVEKIVKPE